MGHILLFLRLHWQKQTFQSIKAYNSFVGPGSHLQRASIPLHANCRWQIFFHSWRIYLQFLNLLQPGLFRWAGFFFPPAFLFHILLTFLSSPNLSQCRKYLNLVILATVSRSGLLYNFLLFLIWQTLFSHVTSKTLSILFCSIFLVTSYL